MILPNLQKYEFLDSTTDNIRALSVSAVNGKVLFCPKLGSIHSWWIPKSSPNAETGGWSKLKHIDITDNLNKVSLWSRGVITDNHITDLVEDQIDCYLVPMNDVSYSCHKADGINFNIYIKSEGIFYSTNVLDKKDELMVVSLSKDYQGTLYSLEDNNVVYDNKVPFQTTLDSWMNVENDDGWEWNQTDNLMYPDDTPATPRTVGTPRNLLTPKTPPNAPPCQRDLMDTFDKLNSPLSQGLQENMDHNVNQTMKLLEETYQSEESEIELTSGSDEEGQGDLEQDSSAESDYEPSEVSSEASDYTITTIDEEEEQDYYDNYHDEMRQDLDGWWYTRRQFYDFYGTDDAWDNLDPHIYQKMRLDENDGLWYTKEQFYQYYGTDVIWKKMDPKKRLVRQTICNTYHWASYLPDNLRSSFICRYLGSY